ncbi:hypothetical protein D9613_011085 [Agrocybe pediades]|uniref:F-box domain-containing protein n=1 Tax=Agrocybe pediades TaxID=84607 RepID=A0A8H4QLD5_9AGAR|nr:hypothetical protein D9613_011085 [Agrocybe pediades]
MVLDTDAAVLLQSNIPPDTSMNTKFNLLLAELLQESSHIDEEISRLEETIAGLRRKKAGAQSSIDAYQKILSPARRVPDDVWREIFYCCLPTHRDSTMHPRDAPLLLTRVCSQWRQIAFSSPLLWSRLYIPLLLEECGGPSDVPSKPRYREEYMKALHRRRGLRGQAIKEWLQRSGNCSLSVTISCPSSYFMDQLGGYHHDSDINITYVQQTFDILLPFATRWESVELLTFGSLLLKMFQATFSSTTIANLKTMKLDIQSGYSLEVYPLFNTLLQSVPTLTKISVGPWLIVDDPRQLPLTWYNFTDIYLHFRVEVNIAFQLLSACHKLVNCFVSLDRAEGEALLSYPHDYVVLPHLRTFVVDGWSGEHTPVHSEFLRRILAPALHRFAYRTPFRTMDEVPSNLKLNISPFLVGSPRLEALSLNPTALPPSDVLKCLSITKHVRRIVLGHDPDFDIVPHWIPSVEAFPDVLEGRLDPFDLKHLAVPAFGHSSSSTDHIELLLPELEALVAYRISDLTDEDLFAVIKSRLDAWKGGKAAALKHVKLEFLRMMQKDISSDIVRYAEDLGLEQGRLKIELKYVEREERLRPFSPLYGLRPNDCTWPYRPPE